MSNKKQKESAIDYVMVFWTDGKPLLIKAKSNRAKALFMQWGVAEEVEGIDPPEKPNDFTESIPRNWVVSAAVVSNTEVAYVVQEISLPQPRLMLH